MGLVFGIPNPKLIGTCGVDPVLQNIEPSVLQVQTSHSQETSSARMQIQLMAPTGLFITGELSWSSRVSYFPWHFGRPGNTVPLSAAAPSCDS